MTWDDWLGFGVIILGIILFLYGANYYDATVGWIGVLLFVGAVVALVVLYVYKSLTQRKPAAPAAQNP
jgi:drug/metabolite transporter (DMT)-like permease